MSTCQCDGYRRINATEGYRNGCAHSSERADVGTFSTLDGSCTFCARRIVGMDLVLTSSLPLRSSSQIVSRTLLHPHPHTLLLRSQLALSPTHSFQKCEILTSRYVLGRSSRDKSPDLRALNKHLGFWRLRRFVRSASSPCVVSCLGSQE